jgi:hypothetical protein
MAAADADGDAAVKAALALMRRLPPAEVEDNVQGVAGLLGEADADRVLQSADRPLKTAHDPEARRPYLCLDANRDGDSWRCVRARRAACDPPARARPGACARTSPLLAAHADGPLCSCWTRLLVCVRVCARVRARAQVPVVEQVLARGGGG